MSINRLRGVIAESKFRCDRRGLAPNGKRSALVAPGRKNEKEEENSLAQNLIHIPRTLTVNIN